MSEKHSRSAKARWENTTPHQRKKQTSSAVLASRISAAKRRIAKANKQIATDLALIEELTSSD